MLARLKSRTGRLRRHIGNAKLSIGKSSTGNTAYRVDHKNKYLHKISVKYYALAILKQVGNRRLSFGNIIFGSVKPFPNPHPQHVPTTKGQRLSQIWGPPKEMVLFGCLNCSKGAPPPNKNKSDVTSIGFVRSRFCVVWKKLDLAARTLDSFGYLN